MEAKGEARSRIAVAHERLPTYDEVEVWHFYWADWLAALDDV